jgi:hypothetical protein
MNKTKLVLLFIFLSSISKAQTKSDIHLLGDSNLIIKKDWGIYFTKCSNWCITNNMSNSITLRQTSLKLDGPPFEIDYVVGDTITDDNPKYGWIKYWYDSKERLWMKKIEDDTNPKPADTLAVLADGFPIFNGIDNFTLIIPLSHKSFLRCGITFGSSDDIPRFIVGTIRKIQ